MGLLGRRLDDVLELHRDFPLVGSALERADNGKVAQLLSPTRLGLGRAGAASPLLQLKLDAGAHGQQGVHRLRRGRCRCSCCPAAGRVLSVQCRALVKAKAGAFGSAAAVDG